MITFTRDANFIIDTLPRHPQIVIASPCSGGGFKHSAAIGQVLSELALNGKSSIPIEAFSMSRFAIH
jgi:sarcosine oxidase